MTKKNEAKLLGNLKEKPNDDLGKTVAEKEGLGGALIPQYSKRRIKCITVLEGEIDDLGSFNLGSSICFSISAFCFGLWIDIFKDKKLSESIPLEPPEALFYVERGSILAMILFFCIGSALWIKKNRKIKKIKEESTWFEQV